MALLSSLIGGTEATGHEAAAKFQRKRSSTKSVLRLPDLELAKAAVLSSLNSTDAKRGILGTGGDEVIHVLLDVMYAKAPYTVIQRAMHIHPTVAEYLPTVLFKLEPFA